MPITKAEKHIGSVQVYLTPKFQKEELYSFIKAIGITSSFLIIVVFLSIYLITKTMIVQPISNLTNLADQISMGILDTDIPSGSKTEIGLLAESLNRLKVSVVIALDRLKKT
jgi:HAMP domain-containing protein